MPHQRRTTPGRQPSTEQTATGQPATGQPAPGQPAPGQPAPDQTSTDPPAPDEISTDRYVWDLARQAGQALRDLNYATGSRGLAYAEPADLDAVLVELALLVGDLPQFLGQAATWLATRHQAGTVRHDSYLAATDRTVAEAVALLATAQSLALPLSGALDAARQHTATLAAGEQA
jgi:hypothetical protein